MCSLRFTQRISFRQVTSLILLCALLSGCGSGLKLVGGNPVVPPSTMLTFALPVLLGTNGSNPASIAIADFNGDGKLDIAVSNFFSNTISIFINRGTGIFNSPILVPVTITDSIGAIAVGDFNEDGKPDLVVGTISGPQADIVLLNTGNGTFAQQAPIPNSFGFFQAVAVDLNGDGHLDLVRCGNAFVSVSLGKGDGTFSASVDLTLSPNTAGPVQGLVVKDFNGDGKLDVVAVQPTTVVGNNFTQGNLLFFAGNGDGTFKIGTSTPLGLGELVSIVAGDFSGDGKQDVVVGTAVSALLLPGNGDGTFGKSVLVVNPSGSTATNFVELATADFDVDGKPDVIATNSGSGTETLVLNNALGVFPPPANTSYTFNLIAGVAAIAVGDFSGDGLPDFVTVNNVTNQISIILSQK